MLQCLESLGRGSVQRQFLSFSLVSRNFLFIEGVDDAFRRIPFKRKPVHRLSSPLKGRLQFSKLHGLDSFNKILKFV